MAKPMLLLIKVEHILNCITFTREENMVTVSPKRNAIIKTAAKLIMNDIRSTEYDKTEYPSSAHIMSVEGNRKIVPDSLQVFLKQLIDNKNSKWLITSLGQAIAALPRSVICPLKLGLGVQLYHQYGSRFLIEALNSLGFCSSYHDFQRFETSAVISQEHIIHRQDDQFVQFIGDNVDHNTETLDGHNTFHGIGIVATETLKDDKVCLVPGIRATSDDLINIGKLNIHFYKQSSNGTKTTKR
ncbi:LOW QUALITY PROTEIN: hypothetical protein MAR_027752 [Mya arenaria]|uniref:Uncharacterized protein n=1 Tax=Mya arenaria TaxID=6604 RepID=A0ABY7EXH9_MYAAR|nr:LOW QUALITY PROTEIN: hypothetical protein MAR_027752 [Mya arenaria]